MANLVQGTVAVERTFKPSGNTPNLTPPSSQSCPVMRRGRATLFAPTSSSRPVLANAAVICISITFTIPQAL